MLDYITSELCMTLIGVVLLLLMKVFQNGIRLNGFNENLSTRLKTVVEDSNTGWVVGQFTMVKTMLQNK